MLHYWGNSYGFAGSITTNLLLDLDAGNPSSYSGTGSTWNDLSGNGFNATLVNSPEFSSGSLIFNGTNQFATLPNLGMSPSGARTLSAWVKPSSTTGAHSIFGYGTLLYLQSFIVHLNISANGQLYVGFNNADFSTTEDSYNTSAFWNFCVTYAGGAINTTNVVLYINGSAVAVTPAGLSIGSTADTTNQNYRIAQDNNQRYYAGAIGRLSFYSRALSASEVLQNFNADKTRFNL
jgi:hypothetical protein